MSKIRHYGRNTEDSLTVRDIDLPDGKIGWVIDDTDSTILDTRGHYGSRRAALEALEELREMRELYR